MHKRFALGSPGSFLRKDKFPLLHIRTKKLGSMGTLNCGEPYQKPGSPEIPLTASTSIILVKRYDVHISCSGGINGLYHPCCCYSSAHHIWLQPIPRKPRRTPHRTPRHTCPHHSTNQRPYRQKQNEEGRWRKACNEDESLNWECALRFSILCTNFCFRLDRGRALVKAVRIFTHAFVVLKTI